MTLNVAAATAVDSGLAFQRGRRPDHVHADRPASNNNGRHPARAVLPRASCTGGGSTPSSGQAPKLRPAGDRQREKQGTPRSQATPTSTRGASRTRRTKGKAVERHPGGRRPVIRFPGGGVATRRLIVFAVNTFDAWSNAPTNEFDISSTSTTTARDDYIVVGADQGLSRPAPPTGHGRLRVQHPERGPRSTSSATAPTDGSRHCCRGRRRSCAGRVSRASTAGQPAHHVPRGQLRSGRYWRRDEVEGNAKLQPVERASIIDGRLPDGRAGLLGDVHVTHQRGRVGGDARAGPDGGHVRQQERPGRGAA